MKAIVLIIVIFSFLQYTIGQTTRKPRFNPNKDLLLAHFDCKTDVDDLHSVAALITLLSQPDFKKHQLSCSSRHLWHPGRFVRPS